MAPFVSDPSSRLLAGRGGSLALRSASVTGPGGRSPSLWLDATYLNVAAASSWTMPAPLWHDCSAFMCAYVLLQVDYLSTSGGDLDLYLESAPVLSNDAGAWTTVASVTGMTTTGPRVLKVLIDASNPITGVLRLRVQANTAAVACTIRAELLLKQRVHSLTTDWLPALYIAIPATTSWVLPATLWVDTSEFADALLLCSFSPSSGSGSDLSLTLQTSPLLTSEETAWKDVGTYITFTTSPKVYDGRHLVTNPPMGVLRIKLTAGASGVAGSLRVQLLQKNIP